MKKIISIISVIATTISCSNAQQTEFSKETLEYQLTTKDNNKVSFNSILEKNKGKKIVIEIWAGWCSDCVKAMPKVKEMQATNPNVAYVFISMDKQFDKWNTAIEKHEIIGEHYWVNDEKMMKGEFGKSLDIDWIPRYIVVNKLGKIELYRAIETDFEKIDKVLKTK
ncbi:TlpA family protein disulfide reductase [Flavobacterium sp.]|uniref:TlpA family protein disulfide reductase n=1 Tax=Flavobacterium sp. TaxID=239 RepID=UPI0037533D4E